MPDTYWERQGTRAASLIGVRPEEGLVAEPVRQVGRWFERVHLAGLATMPGVEILAANRALRGHGRTLGELDVLYRVGDRVVHREVAVKFYLARQPGNDPALWVGPGKKDRLDLKLERLATHQSKVATLARDRDAWPEDLPFPDVTEVLLLGSLFCSPAAPCLPEGIDPRVDRGWWYSASEFGERFKDGSWCILEKPWWLSPEHARLAPMTTAQAIAQDLTRPRFVGRVCAEVERAFVVPDGWCSNGP